MIPYALITSSASALVSNIAAKPASLTSAFAPAGVSTLAETHDECEFVRAGAARNPACFIERLLDDTEPAAHRKPQVRLHSRNSSRDPRYSYSRDSMELPPSPLRCSYLAHCTMRSKWPAHNSLFISMVVRRRARKKRRTSHFDTVSPL